MQMKRTDPRVNELFSHVRKAIELLEQMMLRSLAAQDADQPGDWRFEELTRCSLFNRSAQPHKLIYSLICLHISTTLIPGRLPVRSAL